VHLSDPRPETEREDPEGLSSRTLAVSELEKSEFREE
jgi:hypothetical protein